MALSFYQSGFHPFPPFHPASNIQYWAPADNLPMLIRRSGTLGQATIKKQRSNTTILLWEYRLGCDWLSLEGFT